MRKNEKRWEEIESYLTTSGGGEAVDPNERGVTDGLHEPILPWYVLLLWAAVTDEIRGESDWNKDCNTDTDGACASRCRRRHFSFPPSVSLLHYRHSQHHKQQSKLLGFLTCLDLSFSPGPFTITLPQIAPAPSNFPHTVFIRTKKNLHF